MNKKYFGDGEPPSEQFFEDITKFHLKMLIAIVNREDGERAAELFRERRFRMQFSILAEGTSRSMLANLFGLGSTERTIAICVSQRERIDALKSNLVRELNLDKSGNGIAFTIPLSGIDVPIRLPRDISMGEKLNNSMEKEVDEMSEGFTHDLVLAIVNNGNSDELVEAARTVGARGGTVINARRTGMDEAVKFFGISVQEEREVVAIVTARETKAEMMKTLNESFGMKSQAHGIILSLPIDSVSGLEG